VELLVVIGILILVVALALPAITRSIEAADRNQCGAKAAKLATAMGAFDALNNVFPGVRNRLDIKSPDGSAPVSQLYHWKGGPFIKPGDFSLPTSNVNWFIMILPHIGFVNTFNDCVDGKVWQGTNISHSRITNDMTYCVSRSNHYDIANGARNMFYRANGAGAGGAFHRNDGAIGDNANNVFVSLADVAAADGASSTLLIAEGTGENWFPNTWVEGKDLGGRTSYGAFNTLIGNNAPTRYHVVTDVGGNLLFGFISTSDQKFKMINNGNSRLPNSISGSVIAHSGGANVAFVDGSWKFLKDDMAPHVYGHLVTHRSVWDGTNYSTNSPAADVLLKCPPAPRPYTLKPEDY
jgi:prepilin-type processing-associated H-X9-DG protein